MACSLCGCHLIGAGAGATIDTLIPGPFQPQTQCQITALKLHEDVRLILNSGTRVQGAYLGLDGPSPTDPRRYVVLETDDGMARVAEHDIAVFGVEVNGKGWLYGGLIGLAVDIVVLFVVLDRYGDNAHTGSGGWGLGLGR